MGIVQRIITGESIYQAILAEGAKLIRGNWFDVDNNGMVTSACLLGKAALNLHIAANEDYTKNSGDSLLTQLDRYQVPKDNPWFNSDVNNYGIGTTMISRYDAIDHWEYDEYGVEYPVYLISDVDIPEFLREILASVWDTQFTVDSYEFDINDYNSASNN